ncbi:MAG TPA: hypothetical protein VK564_11415 [Thermodesulfobacteriota bacterium]|nr:hypothetical protein [Thermodesulfobacteriota bacterium]
MNRAIYFNQNRQYCNLKQNPDSAPLIILIYPWKKDHWDAPGAANLSAIVDDVCAVMRGKTPSGR